MDLASLRFKIDTSELVQAETAIKNLGTAVNSLNKPISTVTAGTENLSVAQENVSKSSEKLSQSQSKATSFLEKHTLAMKIFRGETVQVGTDVLNLGSSFTKGQSGQLAMQTLIGGTSAQISNLAKEFIDFNKITSANTFDNSIQGVSGLNKAISEMNKVNELMKSGIALTRDEIVNLMRDSERLTQQFKSEGLTAQQLQVALGGLEQETIRLSKEKNTLIARTKESELAAKSEANAQIKARNDAAKATEFLTREMNRVDAALSEVNASLLTSNSNRLVKFEAELKKSGMSAADAAANLELYRKKLMDLQATGTDKQLDNMEASLKRRMDHLSRSLAPQMSDIAVSLYGGMSPLTVLMQQGLQIRDLIQQSGVESKNVSEAIKKSMVDFVGTLSGTFKAIGGMTAGVFQSLGKSMIDLAGTVLLPTKSFDDLRNKMIAAGGLMGETNSKVRFFDDSFKALTTTMGVIGVGLIAAFTAIGIAMYQVTQEQTELSKALVLTGASLGFTKDTAVAFAETIGSVSITKGTESLKEFATAGVKSSESLKDFITVAADMEKYVGVPIAETAKEIKKLQGDPVIALNELAISSGRVTVETLKQAQSFKELGEDAKLASLAEEEYIRVKEQQSQAAKAGLTPVVLLWNAIKKAIGGAWEEIKNIATSDAIIAPLTIAFKTVTTVVTFLWNAVKSVAQNIGGLVAIAGSAIEDLSNADFGFAKTKQMMSVVKQGNDDLVAANNKAIKSIWGIGEANQAANTEQGKLLKEQSQSAINFQKNLAISKDVKDKLLAQSKREITQQEYINARLDDYREKVGKSAVDQEVLTNMTKLYGEEWEKTNKKKNGIGTGTRTLETFDTPRNNIANIQKEYSSELKLAEQQGRDERSILKNNYDAKLITRGAFLARDIALIVNSENARLDVIKKYSVIENKAFSDTIKAIKDEQTNKLSLAKTDRERININEKAKEALNGVTESQRTFNELQTDKVNALNSETLKRYSETLKETTAITAEANKVYLDFTKTQNDAIEKRKLQSDMESKLSLMRGDDAANYKARTEAMQSMLPVLSELESKAKKSSDVYSEFTDNMLINPESISTAMQLWMQAEDTKALATKSRVDAEVYAAQAGTDATVAYYKKQMEDISSTVSGVITTSILEGGEAGGNALKAVLQNTLKDALNSIFKMLINQLGNSIMQLMNLQSSSASSSGGLLQTIIGAGLSGLAGGFGASSGTGATISGGLTGTSYTPSYSLSSSSSSLGLQLPGRASGGAVGAGGMYEVNEKGPEVLTVGTRQFLMMGNQSGNVTPNQSGSSDPMKVTIINNTSSPIGRVTEQKISQNERALIIEEAVLATAAQMNDPNSKTSKSLGANYRLQRNR